MPTTSYGLLVVERGGAALGTVAGERVTTHAVIESAVMGKHKAGGQSAQRFERDRKRQLHEFFETVGERASQVLLDADSDPLVEKLAIGGTAVTVEAFLDDGYLDHRLRDAILGTYTVAHGGEQGLHQLAERAADAIDDAERAEERARLERFKQGLADSDDAPPVTYGVEAVEQAIEYGAVDVLLCSTAVGADTTETLAEATRDRGGEVLYVGTGSDGGHQLRAAFGGVAALLRFPVD